MIAWMSGARARTLGAQTPPLTLSPPRASSLLVVVLLILLAPFWSPGSVLPDISGQDLHDGPVIFFGVLAMRSRA